MGTVVPAGIDQPFFSKEIAMKKNLVAGLVIAF